MTESLGPPDRHTAVMGVQRWRDGRLRAARDEVATEEPLEIRVVAGAESEPVSVSVTMRTPGEDFELAVGFLFGEGLLRGSADVDRVDYCVDDSLGDQTFNVVNVRLRSGAELDVSRLERHFYATSSCGVCGKASLDAVRAQGCVPISSGAMLVEAPSLRSFPEILRRSQAVFGRTGGLHAAGLFDASGRLLLLREDVGRHNAVDKVIGAQVLARRVPMPDLVLLVSGRAGFEIVQKAAMAGIPLLAAVGAPSTLAIDTAEEFGLTLVGFLHGAGFNVYTGAARIASN